ncbi:MAG: Flp pilus assembly protein CpaB [Planctomycetes bacterium]|nr:Flp pilus assembly protein CpaB [Planctomycetota bacterium]MBI3835565.1 Flp pilus assembly protein CpaB [Planctomycetota bacterium]
MKRNAIIPLVLGLTIGLVAVKFGVDAIRRAKASGGTNITAVRTKMDINSFEKIKPEMIEAVETTDSLFAPANERISDMTKAVGRVTSKAVPKGSPLLLSMLAPEGTNEGMVGRIPQGFRGISIKIDEATGVAYHLKVGDWVDVSVVMDVESGARGKKDVISEVLLQHVQVAAVGYGQDAGGGGSDAKAAMKPAKSATLLVAEEDVPKLHLAMTRGKVSLALRGDDDTLQKKSTIAFESEMGSGKAKDAKPEPEMTAKTTPPPPKPVAPKLTARDLPCDVLVYHRWPNKATQSVEQITFQNPASSKIVAVSVGLPTRAAAAMNNTRTAVAQRPRSADHPKMDQGPESNTALQDEEFDSDEGDSRPQE